jgi:hypothetical protein
MEAFSGEIRGMGFVWPENAEWWPVRHKTHGCGISPMLESALPARAKWVLYEP